MMSNIDKIKNIVAAFLRVDSSLVFPDTKIDKSAINGSIMIHKMYAALSRELGYDIDKYYEISTFNDLIVACRINESMIDNVAIKHENEKRTNNQIVPIAVGIDIEDLARFPESDDYYNDNFYKQNFSQEEIKYCLSQRNPLESFAGKFAAKEAIVKADNIYKKISFSKIVIMNNSDGKPEFSDFSLSISHSTHVAVAVAIKFCNISKLESKN